MEGSKIIEGKTITGIVPSLAPENI